MKYAVLFAALFVASHGRAAEFDYRSFFCHPEALIVIDIGTSRSKAIPYKSHSIPATPEETLSFRDGFGTSGGGKPALFVQWSFIKKTEYGDVYLFSVEKDKAVLKAFPILYKGSTIVAYERDEIRVTIEPQSEDH